MVRKHMYRHCSGITYMAEETNHQWLMAYQNFKCENLLPPIAAAIVVLPCSANTS